MGCCEMVKSSRRLEREIEEREGRPRKRERGRNIPVDSQLSR